MVVGPARKQGNLCVLGRGSRFRNLRAISRRRRRARRGAADSGRLLPAVSLALLRTLAYPLASHAARNAALASSRDIVLPLRPYLPLMLSV